MINSRLSIISLLLMFSSLGALACAYQTVERYYMFRYGDGPITAEYQADPLEEFWREYCNKEWVSDEDRMDAAQRRGDTAMKAYLTQLMNYQEVVNQSVSDSWDYPTAAELRSRKARLTAIVKACSLHHTGKYADRWTLLQMRANLLMRNYAANLTLWNTVASKFPESALREKMRNIYANALLHTGKKVEAWNIYAEQNDHASLLWSIRKFTNLAGINQLYRQYPDAPVLEYLLETYVNNIQDVIDSHNDNGKYDPEEWGQFSAVYPVYAQIRPDYLSEIKSFCEVSRRMASEGKVSNPSAWMTASALVNYYLGNYAKAESLIDQAMQLRGTDESKKMTRRIKMLVSTATHDINSPDYQKYIADELAWLDNDIAKNKQLSAINARTRILNLGVGNALSKAGEKNLATAVQVLLGTNDSNSDYSSEGFMTLNRMTPQELENYFRYAKNPGDNLLALYVFGNLNYSDDYVNDLMGTVLLRNGEFQKALPYLEKVSQDFLNRQAIAYYVNARDYRKPSWEGWQTLGRYDYNRKSYNLEGNVKARFCRDILELQKRHDSASGSDRELAALEMAGYLYNASMLGQSWFITDYSQTAYPESIPTTDFSHRARTLLSEAAASANPSIRSKALFGLVGTAPDNWYEDKWNSNFKLVRTILPSRVHYKALTALDSFLKSHPSAATSTISRCDVLKQFRRSRK